MTVIRGGDLAVAGAGGFGRETVEAICALNVGGACWQLLGYLDDDPALSGAYFDGIPVLGGLAELKSLPDASVVVCTGRPDNYLAGQGSSRHLILVLTDTPPSSIRRPQCRRRHGSGQVPFCFHTPP